MGNKPEQGGRGLVPGGTTPVPTALLDKVMPALRDTELRVLLVVVRQTLGWQVGKDPLLRKERDWLTQTQLMRRTGRAGGAVAGAIDALVQRGLIDVLDGQGRPLNTPAERRRCRGRLYYRLHQECTAGPGSERPTDTGSQHAAGSGHGTESGHAKPHTTKTTPYKNKSGYKNKSKTGRPVDNPVEKPQATASQVSASQVIRSSGWERAGGNRTPN